MWIKLTVGVVVVREFDEVVGGVSDRLAADGMLLMGQGWLGWAVDGLGFPCCRGVGGLRW